jgi:branched-subunit amino acid ABC-type transport system permease component
MQLLIELLLAGSVAGVKVGIAALGFALIFFASREMHFAFGALCVLGGYVCYWVATALSGGALGVLAGIIAAFVVAALLSVALHKYLYLKLRSVTPVLMASIGIGIILENSLQIVAGPDISIFAFPSLTHVVEIGFLRIRALDVYVLLLFVVIAISLDLFMSRTRLGEGLGATIEDPEMAELVGIRTERMRTGAYCAGAVLGATTGIIQLLDTGVRSANGFLVLLYALIITIVGRGSLRAVAIWSVIFGVARSLWSWQFASGYTELAVFGMMVAYLMVRDFWDRFKQGRISSSAGAEREATLAPAH